MGMGFILPFALVFVAIPLETFVHSLRTVLGMLVNGLLRILSTTLRLAGNTFRYFGSLFIKIYDLPLFLPLWLAGRAERQNGAHKSSYQGVL